MLCMFDMLLVASTQLKLLAIPISRSDHRGTAKCRNRVIQTAEFAYFPVREKKERSPTVPMAHGAGTWRVGKAVESEGVFYGFFGFAYFVGLL